MEPYNWSAIEEETLNPLISRRVIHTERMTICRIRLKKGAVVPMHSHENEQVTMLESGSLRFIFENEEKIIHAGDALPIPPHAPVTSTTRFMSCPHRSVAIAHRPMSCKFPTYETSPTAGSHF